MLLFLIGESLGMQELIMIGVIALIIFGPRKLPQIARTIGKTMAEFRKATNEFRSTWDKTPSAANSISKSSSAVALPEVRALEESDFGKMALKSQPVQNAEPDDTSKGDTNEEEAAEPRTTKRDWL
jgi:TatA/E family protein of Tat protein translocase